MNWIDANKTLPSFGIRVLVWDGETAYIAARMAITSGPDKWEWTGDLEGMYWQPSQISRWAFITEPE